MPRIWVAWMDKAWGKMSRRNLYTKTLKNHNVEIPRSMTRICKRTRLWSCSNQMWPIGWWSTSKTSTSRFQRKCNAFWQEICLSKVFNSLTIPTTDFYLSFDYNDNPWLKRANLKVVSIKVSLNICYCHQTTSWRKVGSETIGEGATWEIGSGGGSL